ncbi:hypothetical protein J6X04_03115 [Candidatus Saccharibacteria bacterium]|nr:hypothetical protein [Candidatus Saccharibacteria bacterium]
MKRFLVVVAVFAMSVVALPVNAISDNQVEVIKERCESIRDNLKVVQKNDAKARVHLGGRFETVLSKFIMPLNMRLVENGLPSAELVENQNDFSKAKTIFVNDYINYQQELEELVAMDCKNEPKQFYEKLEKVRQKRKMMEQDVMKLRTLITNQIKIVTGLRSKI